MPADTAMLEGLGAAAIVVCWRREGEKNQKKKGKQPKRNTRRLGRMSLVANVA